MLEPVETIAVDSHQGVVDCPNCGGLVAGHYCPQCGQKRFSHHDLTVKHFLSHAVHELTHLESSRIVTTIVALLFRPGQMTKAYIEGRQQRYVNPVRLYLTISALFFLFAW